MTTGRWLPVPLHLSTDAERGGRWTSLRTSERDWLWTNPDPEIARDRRHVAPGAAFIDAGGAEECIPTVRGKPDHGDAWTRAWSANGARAAVDVAQLGRLTRRIGGSGPITVDYELTGRPGTPFLHALHALLDVTPAARMIVPGSHRMTVLDVDEADREWPSGLDKLGPDDGTAVCALLPGCHEVAVVDGDHSLRFEWDSVDAPEMCSLLLWRNLRGWPAGAPYRSIGIEPMVGQAADLSRADLSASARIGLSGRFRWSLRLSCHRLDAP